MDWLWATKTHKHKYKKSTHKQTNPKNTHTTNLKGNHALLFLGGLTMSNPFLPDLSGNAHRPEPNLRRKSFVMIMTFDTSRSIEMSQYCEDLCLIVLISHHTGLPQFCRLFLSRSLQRRWLWIQIQREDSRFWTGEKIQFLYRCKCYVFGDRNVIALTIDNQQ